MITKSGEDLLPGDDWLRNINFPRLSENKSLIIFDIKANAPSKVGDKIKEISGKLEYEVSEGTKEIDLGITKLTPGSKGTKHGAVIKEIKESSWAKDQKVVSLELDMDKDSIVSISFYDSNGNNLNLKDGGYSSYANTKVTYDFNLTQALPENGKVKVVTYKNRKLYEADFKLDNISLPN